MSDKEYPLVSVSSFYQGIDSKIVIETFLSLRVYQKLQRYREEYSPDESDMQFLSRALEEGWIVEHTDEHYLLSEKGYQLLESIDDKKISNSRGDYATTKSLDVKEFKQIRDLITKHSFYYLIGDDTNLHVLLTPDGLGYLNFNPIELSELYYFKYILIDMYRAGGDELRYNVLNDDLIHLYAVSDEGKRVSEAVFLSKG